MGLLFRHDVGLVAEGVAPFEVTSTWSRRVPPPPSLEVSPGP